MQSILFFGYHKRAKVEQDTNLAKLYQRMSETGQRHFNI